MVFKLKKKINIFFPEEYVVNWDILQVGLDILYYTFVLQLIGYYFREFLFRLVINKGE